MRESQSLSPGLFPKRSPSALWREVEGNAVLFHEETGRAFALSSTATRIWKLCDGSRSLDDISSTLAGLHGGDSEDLAGQVKKLASGLCQAGFLELADAPTPVAMKPAPAEKGPHERWRPPVAEEIVFAACECGQGAGVGLCRAVECNIMGQPQQSTSTF